MAEIRSFKDLVVWQKAMELCTNIYEISRAFPNDERFGLTSQIRRAVVSIPSNIAEGYGRQRTQDYLRFLDVALGSLYEVETQLLLCRNLRFAAEDGIAACMSLVRDVDRLLCGLSRAVRNSVRPGTVDGQEQRAAGNSGRSGAACGQVPYAASNLVQSREH